MEHCMFFVFFVCTGLSSWTTMIANCHDRPKRNRAIDVHTIGKVLFDMTLMGKCQMVRSPPHSMCETLTIPAGERSYSHSDSV